MLAERTGRRRVEAPEIRRTQILNAARACFVRGGFGPTKVSDIAAEAGISVGLIYRHFPSKEALIEAIVADDSQAQVTSLLSLLEEPDTSAASAVRRFAETLRPMLMDRARTGLMIEVAAEMARNEAVRAATMAVQATALARVRERLGALSELKLQPDELDVRLRMVSALASGAAIQVAASLEPLSDRFFDRLRHTVEHILLSS